MRSKSECKEEHFQKTKTKPNKNKIFSIKETLYFINIMNHSNICALSKVK